MHCNISFSKLLLWVLNETVLLTTLTLLFICFVLIYLFVFISIHSHS